VWQLFCITIENDFMEKQRLIRAETEEELWIQVKADLESITYPLIYAVNILADNKSVFLNIETDPGGGFESGFQSTSLTAPVPFTVLSSTIPGAKNFRFALHDENFIDKVGKFFGMQDVETGYPEFDKKLVVKTNDVEMVKAIFFDEPARKVFELLVSFNLHLAYYDEAKEASLELTIDRDITDVNELHEIYNAFVHVLDEFERNNENDQN
jgi:hypothetical protein